MKVPSFASMRKPILFAFGLAMATWEIVVAHGKDPYVFFFLAMCLGFIPAKSIDEILRKSGGLFIPAVDLVHEDDDRPTKEVVP
jgi:hypothetical protein